MKCSAEFALYLFVTANWVSLTNCNSCSSLFTVSLIFAKKFVRNFLTSSDLLLSELEFRVLKTHSFFSWSVKESAIRTVTEFFKFETWVLNSARAENFTVWCSLSMWKSSYNSPYLEFIFCLAYLCLEHFRVC